MNISHVIRCLFVMILCALVGLLPNCKKKQNSHSRLRPLTSYIDYQATKQGITVCVKQLCQEDCKPLLGNRAGRLWKKHRRRKPIIPLQLAITNQTNRLVALQPQDIDLKLTPYNTVARRLHRNSFIQLFGELFAGVAITGALVVGTVIALSTSGLLLVLIGNIKALIPAAIISGAGLLIPPLFLTIGTPAISTWNVARTAKQNVAIKKELKSYSLRHALLIEPYQTVDTLIFVSKDNYKQDFEIAMRDPKLPQNRIPFKVKLQDH